MVTLQNEKIAVKILKKGAELCNLQSLADNTEYIWQAGNEWPKHSPILFPIIGSLKDGFFIHNDAKYKLPRHGLARDAVFEIIAQSTDSVTFQWQSNDATLAHYPFSFTLQVKYQLSENSVSIQYNVINNGVDNMYFSIGAHPAFNVPLEPNYRFEDYELHFEFNKDQAFPISIYPLTTDGLTQKDGTPFFTYNLHKIPLKQSLFEKDAMVFKNIIGAQISIQHPKSSKFIKVSYEHFPYLGIWNKCGANFVCIEPWCGITDNESCDQQFSEKEGIITLLPRKTWTNIYKIEIN